MVKILISACLMGQKVRYNASDLAISSELFDAIKTQVELFEFCPEVAGGLATPRAPAEIIAGSGAEVLQQQSRVRCADNSDVTDAFLKGAHLALEICQQQGISLALMTESSPSCGSHLIHNGEFRGIKIAGAGVTAALLQQHGIQVFSQFQLAELLQEIRSAQASS